MCVSSSICENFERNTPSSIHPREIHQHPRECPIMKINMKNFEKHIFTLLEPLLALLFPSSPQYQMSPMEGSYDH